MLFSFIYIAIVEAVASKEISSMKLESPLFISGQPIPKKYTCQGENISPPLTITDAPENTKFFALIVDDPDAPKGTFDHWIAWNIPGDLRHFEEGMTVPNQGKNGFGDLNYRGPCPPPGGPHRYYFKLYALDSQLNLTDGISKGQLERAMAGHILSQAELIGTFQR